MAEKRKKAIRILQDNKQLQMGCGSICWPFTAQRQNNSERPKRVKAESSKTRDKNR